MLSRFSPLQICKVSVTVCIYMKVLVTNCICIFLYLYLHESTHVLKWNPPCLTFRHLFMTFRNFFIVKLKWNPPCPMFRHLFIAISTCWPPIRAHLYHQSLHNLQNPAKAYITTRKPRKPCEEPSTSVYPFLTLVSSFDLHRSHNLHCFIVMSLSSINSKIVLLVRSAEYLQGPADYNNIEF